MRTRSRIPCRTRRLQTAPPGLLGCRISYRLIIYSDRMGQMNDSFSLTTAEESFSARPTYLFRCFGNPQDPKLSPVERFRLRPVNNPTTNTHVPVCWLHAKIGEMRVTSSQAKPRVNMSREICFLSTFLCIRPNANSVCEFDISL